MGPIDVAPRGRSRPPHLDRVIATLAARQHGLVTRGQLVALGVSASAVDRRLAAGRLHPVHRAVYAVGHPLLSRRGSDLAAVLACGAGAVLSHRPAAALRELIGSNGRPHVTARRSRGAVAGIVVHRSRGLHPEETTVRDGVPCTTWARTLLDLAPEVPASRLVRVLEATVLAGLYDHHELTAVLGRAGGHSGVGPLRRALAQGHHLDPARTRSALEEAFVDLFRTAPQPVRAPRMNAWLVLDDGNAFEIDALWERERLVVELDGRRFHTLNGARRRDRARDAALRHAGYTVVRLGWADVTGRPSQTRRRIAAVLGRTDPTQRGRDGPPGRDP